MRDLLVEIKKHDQVLANCLYYDIGCFSIAVDLTIEIINNYNKNLINSNLDLILLAVRMLQRENVDKTIYVSKEPWIPIDTLNYLHKKYPDFLAFNIGEVMHTDFGCLGVTEKDISANSDGINLEVVIDIDDRIIGFKNAWNEVLKVDWIKKHDPKDLNDFKICKYSLDKLYFNELDEVQEFICANYNGWLSKLSCHKNSIIIPI